MAEGLVSEYMHLGYARDQRSAALRGPAEAPAFGSPVVESSQMPELERSSARGYVHSCEWDRIHPCARGEETAPRLSKCHTVRPRGSVDGTELSV